MSLYHKHFSHIYVEREALKYSLYENITARFQSSKIIIIDNYRDVFFRKNQGFHIQKKSKNIIIAIKKSGFLYRGSDFAQSADNKNFYYNALSMNCLYDCSYCYLQGMYPSANLVFFVNLEDYYYATNQAIDDREYPEHPLFLSLSYDTDLLASEPIAPYCRQWIDFASSNPQIICEVRTKCSNFKPLLDLEPINNVLFAWSISPEEIATQYEQNAPPTSQRIAAAKIAAERGWPIRLCFDPILPQHNWRLLYDECINTTLGSLPLESIRDCTIGTFRMSTTHLRLARQRRPHAQLLQRDWETTNGTAQLPSKERNNITSYIKKSVAKWLPDEKIHVWL